MRTFKQIDILLQLAGFILPAYLFFNKEEFTMIYAIMGLGAWQVISAIIHFFFPPIFWRSVFRKVYYVLSLLSLAFLYYLLFTDPPMPVLDLLIFMLAFTIGLAIFYLIICLRELKTLAVD